MCLDLWGEASHKELACASLSLRVRVGTGRRAMGGREAPFNYLLVLFPWRWHRKLVRTFSAETHSGGHSQWPEPHWPHWLLSGLAAEGAGEGPGGKGCQCVFRQLL